MRQLVVGAAGSGKTTYAKSVASKAVSEGFQVIAVSQSTAISRGIPPEWENSVRSVKTLLEDWESLQRWAKRLNSPLNLPPTLVVIDPIPGYMGEEEAVISLLRNSRKMGIHVLVLDFSTDVMMPGQHDLFDEVVVTAHGHRYSQSCLSIASGLCPDKVRRALLKAKTDVLVIPRDRFPEYGI